MAISWDNFNNGDQLAEIRAKLNSFNGSVRTQVNTQETNINNNTTNIVTNKEDIVSNTEAITTLGDEVSVVDGRVTVLEDAASSKVFAYVKADPAIDLAEGTPQLIATLTVADVPSGVYFQSYSFEVNFGGVKDKLVHFRADIDGATGTTFDIQSDKYSEFKNRLYGYPKIRTLGPYEMKFYMWKESGFTGQVDIPYCDLIIEGK